MIAELITEGKYVEATDNIYSKLKRINRSYKHEIRYPISNIHEIQYVISNRPGWFFLQQQRLVNSN